MRVMRKASCGGSISDERIVAATDGGHAARRTRVGCALRSRPAKQGLVQPASRFGLLPKQNAQSWAFFFRYAPLLQSITL
jgi:hypothetical protein